MCAGVASNVRCKMLKVKEKFKILINLDNLLWLSAVQKMQFDCNNFSEISLHLYFAWVSVCLYTPNKRPNGWTNWSKFFLWQLNFFGKTRKILNFKNTKKKWPWNAVFDILFIKYYYWNCLLTRADLFLHWY